LQDPKLSPFTRWKTVAISVKAGNLSGFSPGGTAIATDDFRVGVYRNRGTSIESGTDFIAVSSNPSDSAGALTVDGVDVEPYIEQIAAGVKFELTDAEVLVDETDSREVTA
jgi:hypothetical protein